MRVPPLAGVCISSKSNSMVTLIMPVLLPENLPNGEPSPRIDGCIRPPLPWERDRPGRRNEQLFQAQGHTRDLPCFSRFCDRGLSHSGVLLPSVKGRS